MRLKLLTLLLPLVSSCASSHRDSFTSPSGITIVHDKGARGGVPSYTLSTSDQRIVGTAPSIIDAKTVAELSGLPVTHTVRWSPTGKTAVIYENMSVASPVYRHILIRQREDSDLFDSFVVNLGTRIQPMPIVYNDWPSVDRVTDTEITLHWNSAPKTSKILISELQLTKPTNSESRSADGGGDQN